MEQEFIFEDRFVRMYLDKEQSILLDVWKEETSNMTEEDFKNSLYRWKDLMIEHQISFAITDAKTFNFTISLEFQEWLIEVIMKGIAKETSFLGQAMILPSSFIENISTQLFTDESNLKAVPTKEFPDIEQSLKWIEYLRMKAE